MGGKQKSTIYGLGSQASEYYGTNVTSTSTTSPYSQQNVDEIQNMRQKITQQEKVINYLRILTKRLVQRVDEMPRAEQPPLAPTCLHSNLVHDDVIRCENVCDFLLLSLL